MRRRQPFWEIFNEGLTMTDLSLSYRVFSDELFKIPSLKSWFLRNRNEHTHLRDVICTPNILPICGVAHQGGYETGRFTVIFLGLFRETPPGICPKLGPV